jgi:oligopeptide transport system permease protein
VLAPSIPVSLLLGSIGLLFALAIGIPAGIYAAVRHNSWADRAAITLAMGGVILPNFILGPLLVMLFAFVLGWLPPAGWGQPCDVILPGFLTGLPAAAMIARLVRSGMIEELSKDYIRAARARGVGEFKVVVKHALKNGVMPVVSYMGPAAANILTGTVVVESLFAIPGMGMHFVHGALNRDYQLVMGAVLLYCVLLMTFNLLVDIGYRFLDPRVEVS